MYLTTCLPRRSSCADFFYFTWGFCRKRRPPIGYICIIDLTRPGRARWRKKYATCLPTYQIGTMKKKEKGSSSLKILKQYIKLNKVILCVCIYPYMGMYDILFIFFTKKTTQKEPGRINQKYKFKKYPTIRMRVSIMAPMYVCVCTCFATFLRLESYWTSPGIPRSFCPPHPPFTASIQVINPDSFISGRSTPFTNVIISV